jgi:hypothetical protein
MTDCDANGQLNFDTHRYPAQHTIRANLGSHPLLKSHSRRYPQRGKASDTVGLARHHPAVRPDPAQLVPG